MMPIRVQLSRAKGWKMPPDTAKVDRSTRWGNPFRVGDRVRITPESPVAVCFSATEAVATFRAFCEHPIGRKFAYDAGQRLAGKNLACWCKLDAPCHADVLLELVNR